MPRPAIVLDLDETLISSTLIHPDASTDFLKFKLKKRIVYIKIRPGLRQFIEQISNIFEVYFFTAAQEDYANKIIDMIAPETPQTHRYFKSHCVYNCGYAVKDLSLLKHSLHHIVLIDDMNGSAMFQPKNLLSIAPWYGDMNDTALIDQLLPVLKKVSKEDDLVEAICKYSDEINSFSAIQAPIYTY